MIKILMKSYGMIMVLIGLCVLFSILTIKEQNPNSNQAANQIVNKIQKSYIQNDIILSVGASNKASGPFAFLLREKLELMGFNNILLVKGIPRDLQLSLDSLKLIEKKPIVIATSGDVLKWRIIENFSELYPELADCKIISPETYFWPDFLRKSNLVAIVDRIVVIAVLAIGMTMVIITGGIDLSVGSLIALSAVISTTIMKILGGLDASAWVVFTGFISGIISCGMIGGLGGALVAKYKVPPFITTLAIMLMGRGLAFMITGGFSIYQVPKTSTIVRNRSIWLRLGRYWHQNDGTGSGKPLGRLPGP